MSEPRKGLLAFIQSPKEECSCKGNIGKDHDKVIVANIFESGEGFPETPDTPPVIIKRDENGRPYAEPPTPPPQGTEWIFGGCFVNTSDSRFSRLVSKYPIPLHDLSISSKRGLLADIYSNKGMLRERCTCAFNGGISEQVDQVVVLCNDPECKDVPTSNRPAVVIDHNINLNYTRAYPDDPPKPRSTHTDRMFGGCYVFADNDMFRRIISPHPLPLHDRQETWEEYERYSR